MPKWMHNRAEHILAKNPSMPKGEALAIATQQSHALGKSPKGYGTAEGKREARAKYTTPKDDRKQANPGHLESAKMAEAFFDELTKIGLAERLARLALTDIPGTPRLMMKQRSPEELAAIQHGVTNGWNKAVAPIKAKADALAQRVPTDIGKNVATHAMHSLIDNPEAIGAMALPIPGVTEGYIFGKKGLEKLIDRVAPLPEHLRDPATFTTQQPAAPPMAANDVEPALAKAAFMSSGKYLLDQVGKPKVRVESAEPPDPSLRVKQGMFPGGTIPSAPAKSIQGTLSKSQNIGAPKPKVGGIPNSAGHPASTASIKAAAIRMAKFAFSESGFGPTGGVFRPQYASFQGRKEIPSPVVLDPHINKQAAIPLTPKGRLSSAMKKGHPKMTGFAGPSQADISKPVGYGEALPGSTKV